MSRHVDTVPADYFANLYASNPDPWGFATSSYEHEKYDATLASLPRETYGSALEIGCSIGVLTQRLAQCCTRLLALDVAPSALDTARARCADLAHVRFEQAAIPSQWPEGRFDLIVLSEVLYFLSHDDIAASVALMRAAFEPGGHLLLVHWLGETHYPLTGDEAAEAVVKLGDGWLDVVHQERAPLYRIDVLQARTDPSETR
ncbi:class I SAM-dependent DNA methyltransferase [uncultured Methylobacterium sp.]|uniref:class I SAM-dependent DNA methyltransferase n=1 Tax=uncultured Methylobacterium sp. TaxID=157278 RepID=UPI0035CB2FDE